MLSVAKFVEKNKYSEIKSMTAKDLTSKLLAAMESEPSKVSDGNNSGLASASESATVLPDISLPFSNLAYDDSCEDWQ
jgi:hypothetical protein